MSMSRRNFEAIAAVIAAEKTVCEEVGDSTIPLLAVAIGIREHCASENPNFDRARFMTACGWLRLPQEAKS